jgi:hypothetical protein
MQQVTQEVCCTLSPGAHQQDVLSRSQATSQPCVQLQPPVLAQQLTQELVSSGWVRLHVTAGVRHVGSSHSEHNHA